MQMALSTNILDIHLGPKMALFWCLLTDFDTWVQQLWCPFLAAKLIFLLKLCVIVLHTCRFHPRKIWLNLNHDDRNIIFAISRRQLLLACCCLLEKMPPP